MLEVKKVAFLTNEFPVITETFILNQIIFLLDKGIDVKIYALYPGRFDLLHSQYLPYQLHTRVTFIANIPKNPILRIKELVNFFYEKGLLNNVASIVRSLNPLKFGIKTFSFANALFYVRLFSIKESDLVHAHFGTMGSFFSKFKSAGLFTNTPLLVSFHGYDLIPNQIDSYQFQYRDLFDQADLITVNSIYTKMILEKISGSSQFQIHILPVGLDTTLFKTVAKQKFKNQKKRIVFCGRLEYWKGPDIAIEIARKLKYEEGIDDFELFMIGAGSQYQLLMKKIEEDKLGNHVSLLGNKSQKDIIEILADSHIFLFPGRTEPVTGRVENQGLALQEAQSMEVPIITSDVGGIKFGVLPDVSGYLITENDIQGFLQAIKNLLHNENRRVSMGQAGRKYIVENFDTSVLGEKLIELYKSVIK